MPPRAQPRPLNPDEQKLANLSGVYEGGTDQIIESVDLRSNGTAVRQLRANPAMSDAVRQFVGKVIDALILEESFSDGRWQPVGNGLELVGKNRAGTERRSVFSIEPNGDLIKTAGDLAGQRYRKQR